MGMINLADDAVHCNYAAPASLVAEGPRSLSDAALARGSQVEMSQDTAAAVAR